MFTLDVNVLRAAAFRPSRFAQQSLYRWATWRRWCRAEDLNVGDRFFNYTGHEWLCVGELRAQHVSPSGLPMVGVYAHLRSEQWCALRPYYRGRNPGSVRRR